MRTEELLKMLNRIHEALPEGKKRSYMTLSVTIRQHYYDQEPEPSITIEFSAYAASFGFGCSDQTMEEAVQHLISHIKSAPYEPGEIDARETIKAAETMASNLKSRPSEQHCVE